MVTVNRAGMRFCRSISRIASGVYGLPPRYFSPSKTANVLTRTNWSVLITLSSTLIFFFMFPYVKAIFDLAAECSLMREMAVKK